MVLPFFDTTCSSAGRVVAGDAGRIDRADADRNLLRLEVAEPGHRCHRGLLLDTVLPGVFRLTISPGISRLDIVRGGFSCVERRDLFYILCVLDRVSCAPGRHSVAGHEFQHEKSVRQCYKVTTSPDPAASRTG